MINREPPAKHKHCRKKL